MNTNYRVGLTIHQLQCGIGLNIVKVSDVHLPKHWPCHIICQLGSGLDSVHGVKAVVLEPTFRLSECQVRRGH